jgi:cytochrome c556
MSKTFPVTALILDAALMLPALSACSPRTRTESEQRTAPAVEHAIDNEQIEELMGKLGAEYLRVWPQEVQEERERAARRTRARRFSEVASVAARLRDAAGQLPSLVEDAELSDERRQEFNDLSARLADQADKLADAARAEDEKRVQAVVNRINSTCTQCHAQFREQAGPLR